MRHPRSAALLTATALAGLSLTLAFAPSAAADIPTPPLGTLTVNPGSPAANGTVRVSGDGCFVVGLGTNTAGAAAAATPTDDPTGGSTPTAGEVSISITGPGDFSGSDTATASNDGTWSADNGVQVAGAGEYTVNATCTLTDPVVVPGGGDGGTGGGDQGGDQGQSSAAAPGQSLSFDYKSVTFTVAAPPTAPTPSLICGGCDNVNPGGRVTISGNDFPVSTSATVSLTGQTPQPSRVDADGALSPVTFIIKADQAAGTLSGSVKAGSASVPFSVVVTLPQAPGGDVDGPIDNGGGTDAGTGDVDTAPVGISYTSSAPTLPNTGADSLWPSVLGGTLLLTGGGLVWLGRRRTAGAPAA